MTDINEEQQREDFEKLLAKNEVEVPITGDIVKGTVISASKSEVKLDIGGVLIGVVRGPELYEEADEYAKLKAGDTVEATVVDEENENGELELSFRIAGQEKAWEVLRASYKNQEVIMVKIFDCNKGGLMARFRQIQGFLPVSQLSPENYPRVSGGDKGKILEKLRSFIGKEVDVKVMTLDEGEDKIIFSEKEVWNELQEDVINKYKIGMNVEGRVTAVTDFGVFVNFDDSMEGLIHISELAWKRIDNPSDLCKVGDKIKAEIINIDGAKIFLSTKKLQKDPWVDVDKKYKIGQIVKGKILKVNPFGLFVELDELIHGLAHISQLGLATGKKVEELYKSMEERDFKVTSIEPKEHRLGLQVVKDKEQKTKNKEQKTKNKEQKTKNKEQDDNKKPEEKKEEKKEVEKTKNKEQKTKNKEQDDNKKPEEKKEGKKSTSAKATADKAKKK